MEMDKDHDGWIMVVDSIKDIDYGFCIWIGHGILDLVWIRDDLAPAMIA